MRWLKRLSRALLGGLVNGLVLLAKAIGQERLYRVLNRPALLSGFQRLIKFVLGKKIPFQNANLQRVAKLADEELSAFNTTLAQNTLKTALISATLDGSHLERTHFIGLDELQTLSGNVLFVGVHINSWEVCRRNLDKLGYHPAYLYRDFENDWFDHRQINQRYRHGKNGIATSRAGRFADHLANGGHGYMLLDIKDKGSNGIKLPLCGIPAWTSSFPAQMALVHGVQLVPVVLRYTSNGYEQHFFPAIDTSSKDLKAITQHLNDALGTAILEQPEQWLLWDTNRWGR